MWWSFSLCALARPLSLAEAVELSQERHLDVLRATLQVDQARSRVDLARSAFDPTLSASATADVGRSKFFLAGTPASSETQGWDAQVTTSVRTRAGSDLSLSARIDRDTTTTLAALGGPPQEQRQSTWGPGIDLTLRQDLLVWLRADASGVDLQGRELSVDVAAARGAWTRQLAAAEVSRAWWDLWLATAYDQVAADALTERTALAVQTQAWLDVGTIAPVELDRVVAEQLGAEIDRVDAAASVARKSRHLATLLALPLDEELEPTGDIDTYAMPVAPSLDRNPELLMMRSELDLEVRSADIARDAGIPRLDLVARGGVGALENSLGDGLGGLVDEESLPYGSLGVEFNAGLGRRNRVAQRSSAEIDEEIARLRYERRRDTLNAELLAAIDRARDAELKLELARRRLNVAAKTEDGERVRVEQGLGRLDELLAASQSRIVARAAVEDARVLLSRSHLDVSLLTGSVSNVTGVDDDRRP